MFHPSMNKIGNSPFLKKKLLDIEWEVIIGSKSRILFGIGYKPCKINLTTNTRRNLMPEYAKLF